jgi:hypothetical protein
VSDEADEVNERKGSETPAGPSHHRDGEDINDSPSHIKTPHDPFQVEVASSSTQHEVRPLRIVERAGDFERIMQICLAEGSITAEEYKDPENRRIIEQEYREVIEELVANGTLVRSEESAPRHEEQIESTAMTSRISKHNGTPKGIFHRLNYSSTSIRKRMISITGKGKTARLTYPRCRRMLNFFLLNVAMKRTVSFKCYAACSLARTLTGKKSTLQRRLQKATQILLTGDPAAPLDLQAAGA